MLLAKSTAATARGAVAVLAVLAVAAAPATAAFPGQNGRIAFHAGERSDTWEIFSMDPNGNNVVNLTKNAASDSEPAYSADGKRIAYVSYGQRDIYVMNADGTGQTRITHGYGVFNSQPAWSPNGTRIAFTRNDFNTVEVYAMDPDGTDVVQLTQPSGDAANFDPAWSPDGSKILFTSTRVDDEGDIFVMDADGGNPTQLTHHPARDQHPAWSPDGTKVVFSSHRVDGRGDIHVMDADGSDVMGLTESPAADTYPAWSPDGTRIAFTSERDDLDLEVYVMNADGSAETNLTHSPGIDRQPDWQPVHPLPPPNCRNDPSGAQEPGPVSGPLHGGEHLAGPLAPVVHRVNCDVIAPLGL